VAGRGRDRPGRSAGLHQARGGGGVRRVLRRAVQALCRQGGAFPCRAGLCPGGVAEGAGQDHRRKRRRSAGAAGGSQPRLYQISHGQSPLARGGDAARQRRAQ